MLECMVDLQWPFLVTDTEKSILLDVWDFLHGQVPQLIMEDELL